MALLQAIILSCQITAPGHGNNGQGTRELIPSISKEIMVYQEKQQKECVKELIKCARNGSGGNLDELKLLNCMSK